MKKLSVMSMLLALCFATNCMAEDLPQGKGNGNVVVKGHASNPKKNGGTVRIRCNGEFGTCCIISTDAVGGSNPQKPIDFVVKVYEGGDVEKLSQTLKVVSYTTSLEEGEIALVFNLKTN